MNALKRAAEILREDAESIRQSHTLGGDWQGEQEAKADHDEMLAVAEQLEAMMPVPWPKKEDITEDMRAGFERLYRAKAERDGRTLERNDQGAYKHLPVDSDWTLYQRAWADALEATTPTADGRDVEPVGIACVGYGVTLGQPGFTQYVKVKNLIPEGTELFTRPAQPRNECSVDQEKWWKPEFCPITNIPFFSWIEHPEDGWVPTYGGPYDSYTIPVLEGGEYVRKRYDHDEGGWLMNEVENVGLQIVDDQLYTTEQNPDEFQPRNEVQAEALEAFEEKLLKAAHPLLKHWAVRLCQSEAARLRSNGGE